jgi:hypothetical protein
MDIGMMCHPTDNVVLEGTRNEVSTGVVDRHEDRGWVEDMMS